MRTFPRSTRVILTGRLSPYPPRQMVNPEHEIDDADAVRCHSGRIVPVYALTAGLGQRFLRRLLFDLVQIVARKMADPLPAALCEQHGLLPLADAVRALHVPADQTATVSARRRLVFDEFFLFSLAVLRQRATRSAHPGIAFRTPGAMAERARAGLPFALTGAQARTLEAVWRDMASPRPM